MSKDVMSMEVADKRGVSVFIPVYIKNEKLTSYKNEQGNRVQFQELPEMSKWMSNNSFENFPIGYTKETVTQEYYI